MRADNVRIQHRIKGKSALIRSARGLLLRVHRFGRGRAVTSADLRWAARAIDALDAAVRVMDEQPATRLNAPGPQDDARSTGQVSVAASRSISRPGGAGAIVDGSH